MDHTELNPTQVNLESTKSRVFEFLTQCIQDIEKTVTTSGMTMRDIGFDAEKYITSRDSYIIEVKMRL